MGRETAIFADNFSISYLEISLTVVGNRFAWPIHGAHAKNRFLLKNSFYFPPKNNFSNKIFHNLLKEPIFFPQKIFLVLAWKNNQFLIITRKNNFPNRKFLMLFLKTDFLCLPKNQFFKRKTDQNLGISSVF